MKFIEVAKARGLKFNEPVFVKVEDNDTPAIGRMLEQKHTAQGIVRTFELAAFAEDFTADGRIANADKSIKIVPFLTASVTHVAIP